MRREDEADETDETDETDGVVSLPVVAHCCTQLRRPRGEINARLPSGLPHTDPAMQYVGMPYTDHAHLADGGNPPVRGCIHAKELVSNTHKSSWHLLVPSQPP